MLMLRYTGFIVFLLAAVLSVNAQQGTGSGAGSGIPSGGVQGPGGSPTAIAEISEKFQTISLGGRIEPENRVVHQIDTAGYVEEVAVEVGDYVDAGQKLLSITRKDDVMDLYKPTVLTARISGRISKIEVQGKDEVKIGEEAVVIIGTEDYLMKAFVSDKDAFRIEPGQRVTARTAGGVQVRGTLISRSPEPDYTTGLFQLNFSFPNSRQIQIGEFVLVDLPIDQTRGVFIRRNQALRRYGKHFIWIVTADMILTAREVLLGRVFGEFVLLEEGLEPGETYLTRLTGREKEGDKVERPAQ